MNKVVLDTNDGKLKRERNRSTINRYIVNKQELKALRTNVPTEVRNLTKMNFVNLQKQHEPYFLLNEKPGQVAKKLNELANLQIMDKALQIANSFIRNTESKIIS